MRGEELEVSPSRRPSRPGEGVGGPVPPAHSRQTLGCRALRRALIRDNTRTQRPETGGFTVRCLERKGQERGRGREGGGGGEGGGGRGGGRGEEEGGGEDGGLES
ncbi:unnamed protein product [Gadus morhua 'NCC']